MITLLASALKLTFVRKALEYGAVALTVFLLVVWLRPAPTPGIVSNPTTNTITVEVPVDRIVTKDVIRYVEDTANAKRLLDENKKLKVQVTQLTETIASHTVRGTGTVTTVPTTDVPEILRPTEPVASVTRYKDWRLDFVHDGKEAKYELTQKFEVLSTTGKNDKGKPVTLVNLFEIGPDGQRLPIPDTQTTTVFATPKVKSKFSVGFTVQAGVGMVDGNKGGIVAAQWLKRGTSPAAEDSRFSLLSPAVFLGLTDDENDNGVEFGLLPVSYNAGRILPVFKDLWVSPFVSYDAKSKGGKYGFAFTASF